MKPVVLAGKPSPGKAYADAFKVKRHEGYLDVLPSSIFPNRYEFQVAKGKSAEFPRSAFFPL